MIQLELGDYNRKAEVEVSLLGAPIQVVGEGGR